MRTAIQAPKSSQPTSLINGSHDLTTDSLINRAHHTKQAIQTKLSISEPGDQYEQEADRLANRVMRMRPPSELSHQDVISYSEDLIPASGTLSAVGEKALGSEDRQFFETRFHHNFADVRVHADHKASESARGLQARAYTVGNNIAFASGEYRPGTTESRHLLAHELSHVIQQRSIGTPNSVILQRQPLPNPTKQTPQSAPAKEKTLKDVGVGVTDPVSGRTAQIIDEVLLRNRKLEPYIGERLRSGLRIAEKGKFIQELSDGNFDDAYRIAYDMSSSESVPSYIKGFYDSKKFEVHLRPDAIFGYALHESVHRLASPHLYSFFIPQAKQVSNELAEVLKEGMTAYFTDFILQDEGLPKHTDAYSNVKKKVDALVKKLGADGFKLVAQFYFQGHLGLIEIGIRLGLSKHQYGVLKGEGAKEVLKKIYNEL